MSESDSSCYLSWLFANYGPGGGGSRTLNHARKLYRRYEAGLFLRPPLDFVGAGVTTFADHDRRAKELQRLLCNATGGREKGQQPGGFPSSGIIFEEGGERIKHDLGG